MDYIKSLERLADETVWVPAKVHEDGTIENAMQAYVRIKGAYKGEGNFKKQQKPTKHGYSDGCDLGTYVMNMHVEYDPVMPEKGATKAEIALDAKVLRYGRYIKRSRLTPQDRIFAQAAKYAALILSTKATAQPTSAEAEQSGSLSGKRPDA
jgi:hypothetical protein